MSRLFRFNELEGADLIVDATYKGGTAGNAGDDPIHKLLGCGTRLSEIPKIGRNLFEPPRP